MKVFRVVTKTHMVDSYYLQVGEEREYYAAGEDTLRTTGVAWGEVYDTRYTMKYLAFRERDRRNLAAQEAAAPWIEVKDDPKVEDALVAAVTGTSIRDGKMVELKPEDYTNSNRNSG